MILSDEYGRIILGTEESPITTYAINAAGWVEAMLRAESVAAWEAAAESRHLLNRVTLDDGAEVLTPAEHVHIAGPIYPAVVARKGEDIYAGRAGTAQVAGDTLTVEDGGEVLETHTKHAEQTWLVSDGAAVVAGDQLAAPVPAVLDTRPHYNLRIGPWAQETLADDGVTPRWQETLMLWMGHGAPIAPAERNKAEDGIKLNQITLIDPTTINSPAMRW